MNGRCQHYGYCAEYAEQKQERYFLIDWQGKKIWFIVEGDRTMIDWGKSKRTGKPVTEWMSTDDARKQWNTMFNIFNFKDPARGK